MSDNVHVADDVREMIVDLLGVDDEEVVPTASFEGDLGGESIDYLDLTFRVEQRYGVRVDFKDLVASNEIATDESGRLLPETLGMLGQKLPCLDIASLEENADVSQVRELITVDVLTQVIQQAVDRSHANKTPTSNPS